MRTEPKNLILFLIYRRTLNLLQNLRVSSLIETEERVVAER
ncbi:hypothetical protein HMPREF0281_00789 [Corynebacterium ammoniagenes DSM 20306]|uniref:Uncharacterized protein n=1 Tax=Corynebacterium ammoniagenes DSM 20306 TaxID=649754 RepID=A0ABN0AGN9_CORAM|nr:hypothetical protein HMPREF0281_00789 [Corynebacterium ammoniagenes DSM 20306]